MAKGRLVMTPEEVFIILILLGLLNGGFWTWKAARSVNIRTLIINMPMEVIILMGMLKTGVIIYLEYIYYNQSEDSLLIVINLIKSALVWWTVSGLVTPFIIIKLMYKRS